MSSVEGESGNPSGVITDADEIAHYDDTEAMERRYLSLRSAVERVRDLQTSWAVPLVAWLDTVPDCAAQADVYVHLSQSVAGGRVLQIGGKGQAVLKALAGGASSGMLITPSQGEADLATRVAKEFGFSDRFTTAVAFAESLPVDSESVDAVVSEGCMHHTNTPEAFRECARVLVPGGRFGAWDPWKARLYTIGVTLFGKRDPDVNCRPIEAARVSELEAIFPTWSEVRLHGAITRYPGLVWSRFVMTPKVSTSYRVTKFDDRVSKHVPALSRNGSSCAILATK